MKSKMHSRDPRRRNAELARSLLMAAQNLPRRKAGDNVREHRALLDDTHGIVAEQLVRPSRLSARVQDSLHRTFQEPDIQIDPAPLDLWKHGRLADAEQSLSRVMSDSGPSSDALASRALLQARLRQWDTALDYAESAINHEPSIIGYIAKSVALVGMGEKRKGYRACDIAFEHFHSSHVTFLLLIKAIIVFIAGDHHDAISRVDDLIAAVRLNSTCYVVQAYMYLLLGNSHMDNADYKSAIHSFETAWAQIKDYAGPPLFVISLISGWNFDDLGIIIKQRLCEALYAAGRTREAGESLLNMVYTMDENPATTWISDFTQRCLSVSESDGDTATQGGEATSFVSVACSPTRDQLLKAWADTALTKASWKDALVVATSFVVPRFKIYRVFCECLERNDCPTDASACFRQMVDEFAEQRSLHHDEQSEWILGKLESVGDNAMSAKRYDDATAHYSAALALGPATSQGLFTKRSKAYMARGLYEAALADASKVAELDPLSPWGYEGKYTALHKTRDYENAIYAYEEMLSKMSHSSDIQVRKQYVNPSRSKEEIRKVVQETILDSPRVLINVNSGRLFDKSEQASAFEILPAFKELISSMTSHIDHARIRHDVTHYYRYAMLSHRWEDNEPQFETVSRTAVYALEESPTHDKLRMFCKIVRGAGLHWAWSDTCCINRSNQVVHQEALIAMFKWYCGAAQTLVLLRGVRPSSRRGALMKSIWNTRAWTLQEYHASKVVLFYNEDWTLYMNLDTPNHKESPDILQEMEEVTGISAQDLIALRPGSNNIRQKLCLASKRETTVVEDAAYSLLGIFALSLSVTYGEGDKALGRLLAQLLMNSGDTSILAWTGKSGSFNSCLPTSITVFHELPTSHIPPVMANDKMEMRSTSSLISTMRLYDRLHELPVPSFAGQRMKLPCLTFKLGPVSLARGPSGRVFRAKTDALGTIEIKTNEDLSRLDSLILIHPWIDFLLDRQPVGGITETIPEEIPQILEEALNDQSSSSVSPSFPVPSNTTWFIRAAQQTRAAARFITRFRWSPSERRQDAASLLSPMPVSPADKQEQALQFLARLRQPFGALLLTPTRKHVLEYKRVAADSTIKVRVQATNKASLNLLMDNVQMLDVL